MPWKILFSPLCPDDDEAIKALCDEWIGLAVAGHFPALKWLLKFEEGKLD